MPWLVGTALIHSLAVTEKRGAFKSWTVLLAITAFSLSLLGTFLVRSGVLTSVTAFAPDPRRGVFTRALLPLVCGAAGGLFARRAPRRATGGQFAPVSRESLLLANNVLLVVAAASVLLGTLYPLVIDALGLGKLSVGPPYFNAVFVPLMVPLLFLVATGPFARWKEASARAIARRLAVPAAVAIAAGIAVPLALGDWHPLPALGVALAAWVACATAANIRERIARSGPRQPRAWYGMHLAHLGLAVCVTGVTLVKGYESEQDVRMAPGETLTMGPYVLRFAGVREVEGPNYRASRGELTLERDGRVLKTMHPEKRAYFSSQMPMTEAAIDSGLTRDIYVSLGEPLDGGAWSVRAHHKPFVDWIWGGALLMALGGFLAASDRRYRVKVAERFAGAFAGGGARG
jgi:cytochrome c-type biogenesis protein CcmF